MDKKLLGQLASVQQQTRRYFLTGSAGLGASLFAASISKGAEGRGDSESAHGLDFSRDPKTPLSPLPPQIAPKARRIIYVHCVGAPSQLELFDYKPELEKVDGQECPPSYMEGKNFAFLTGIPRMLGPIYPFRQHGESGAWMSDRVPHLAEHADDICFIKSMYTDQFNHGPAQLLMQTGSTLLGHASLGAWSIYGLGTENQNLPGYIVMTSGNSAQSRGKELWGAGYLPSVYQGVECRSSGDPVLYLSNPDGVTRTDRRNVLDALSALNAETHDRYGDPETATRTAQFELAFRMQAEATDAFDLGQESDSMLEFYGADRAKPSFAKNCLLARRLAERGVRFIQLFDWGWDSHGTNAREALELGFKDKCLDIDQPIAALLADLKRTGLLEDTLVVFAGEFGRTPMQENRGGSDTPFLGRDHNPSAYTVWMAGGGVRGGYSHGETDPMGFEIARDPVSIHDFHATLIYLLGFDHRKLTYPFQGLEQKLTGVHHSKVVSQVIA